MVNPSTTSSILVTGGTGTLGRHVVSQLRDAGHGVRILSRGRRAGTAAMAAGHGIELATADLATGEGLSAALEGAETVIHCAGTQTGDELKAQHLVEAATRTGVRHLVYISVVGDEAIPVTGAIDRALFGYYQSKLRAELIIAESPVPWTTLHATQFHDLILMAAERLAKLPVVPVPAGFRFQPIDTAEVAGRLVTLALGAPAGLVPPVGGPRVYDAAELVRGYLRAAHLRRPIIPIWLPGKAARAYRAGANLVPDRAVGVRTWEEFLAERVRPRTERAPAAGAQQPAAST